MNRKGVFGVFGVLDVCFGEVEFERDWIRFRLFFLALRRKLVSTDFFFGSSSGGWLACMPVVPEKERFDLENGLCLAIFVGIVMCL